MKTFNKFVSNNIKSKLIIYESICLTIILLFLLNTPANAGYLHIYKNELSFDNSYNNRLLEANKPIQMDFKYDLYRYFGKPYTYAIFRLYRKGEKEPIKYFISTVSKGTNYGGRAEFLLPQPEQSYEIKYYVLPYVSNQPLRSALFGGFLDENDIYLIKLYYDKPGNTDHIEDLVDLKTKEGADERHISIYFSRPWLIKENLDKGKPIKFQWYKGPESSKFAKNMRYSYRLDPIEDWSIYSDSNEATYYFLRAGNYFFQVKAKYTINGIEYESGIASYIFQVNKQIFGLSKKEIGPKTKIKVSPVFYQTKHYSNSKALLIGVSKYQDKGAFIPLRFVNEDVKMFRNILETKYEFKVDVLTENTNKKNIIEKLNYLYENAVEGDRIIFYFSGHGTSIGELGFLVPTDGMSDNKYKTCIGFKYINEWTEKMFTEKKIKHLLIILDACHSGLGVLSKSSRSSPIEVIAKYPSAHMMTAGLLEQEAYIESNKKNSVFTRYLVNGLNGSADYTKDKVISLTELLVYVQDGVSMYVKDRFDKEQTPMMGKIKGSGEMIFITK